MHKPTLKQCSELRNTVSLIMLLWAIGLLIVALGLGFIGVAIYILSGVMGFAIGAFCLAYAWAKGDLE